MADLQFGAQLSSFPRHSSQSCYMLAGRNWKSGTRCYFSVLGESIDSHSSTSANA